MSAWTATDGRSTASTAGDGATHGRRRHRARLAPYVEPHLARRRAGEKHPVHDFLFTYYSFSAAKLLDWQPGWPDSGTPELARAAARPDRRDARPAAGDRRHGRPTFGCFGLHEWAMVHRADETRHPVPLRLGADGHRRGRRVAPDRLLALRRLPVLHRRRRGRSTAPARPRRPAGVRAAGLPARRDGPLQARLPALAAGRLRPGRRLLRARLGHPRPRHARVAVRPRPTWGFEPVRIETPEGKQEYAAAQRGFAERAAPAARPADRPAASACVRPAALAERWPC